MLDHEGYAVMRATSGDEAVEKIRAEPHIEIDLVLLDAIMPGLSGLASARAIRAVRPDIPILFMTGFPDEVSHLRGAGESVIEKPFTIGKLMLAIRGALRKSATGIDGVHRMPPIVWA